MHPLYDFARKTPLEECPDNSILRHIKSIAIKIEAFRQKQASDQCAMDTPGQTHQIPERGEQVVLRGSTSNRPKVHWSYPGRQAPPCLVILEDCSVGPNEGLQLNNFNQTNRLEGVLLLSHITHLHPKYSIHIPLVLLCEKPSPFHNSCDLYDTIIVAESFDAKSLRSHDSILSGRLKFSHKVELEEVIAHNLTAQKSRLEGVACVNCEFENVVFKSDPVNQLQLFDSTFKVEDGTKIHISPGVGSEPIIVEGAHVELKLKDLNDERYKPFVQQFRGKKQFCITSPDQMKAFLEVYNLIKTKQADEAMSPLTCKTEKPCKPAAALVDAPPVAVEVRCTSKPNPTPLRYHI